MVQPVRFHAEAKQELLSQWTRVMRTGEMAQWLEFLLLSPPQWGEFTACNLMSL